MGIDQLPGRRVQAVRAVRVRGVLRTVAAPAALTLLVGFVAVVAPVAVSAPAIAASPGATSHRAQLYGLSGRVTSVSASPHRFTVRAITHNALFQVGGSYVVTTTSATHIISSTPAAASFSAIKVGDVVVVVLTAAGGNFVAISVAVAPPQQSRTVPLPAGFPKAVPLPPSYVVISAESPTTGAHRSYLLDLEVRGTVASVSGGYTGQLKAAGYQILSSRTVNGAVAVTALGFYLVGVAVSAPAGDRLPAGEVLMALNVEPGAG